MFDIFYALNIFKAMGGVYIPIIENSEFIMIMNINADEVYILKLSDDLGQHSLITSIFPAVLFFVPN